MTEFTRVPNIIVEAICKTKLSGRETKVVMSIIRLTYGYRKEKAKIKNLQIIEMSQMRSTHVSNTLSNLVERKIVTKIGNILCLNKNTHDWISLEKLPKSVTLKKEKKLPKSVTKVTKIGNMHIYKENLKKISPLSSKTGCVPCTRQEVLDICKKTGATIQYVHRTNERIANLIEDERFVDKRGRKYKTVYRTLIDWVTRFPETPGFKRSEFENITFEIDSENYLNKNYYLG